MLVVVGIFVGSISLSKSFLSTPYSAKHLHITAKTLFERILRSKAICGSLFSSSRKKTQTTRTKDISRINNLMGSAA
jgi:hypothetical protein